MQIYMAHESPKERRLPTGTLGQILVWVIFCVMAVGTVLATLAVVKC